jgi:RNA polymerase sigma-70 factor, ECF subfamily
MERCVMSSEEDAWVSRARAGDQAAFEAIFQRYERQIYSFVFRMMGDADDAYDLTQDCFIKAYRNLEKTNGDLNVSAWLHRIASNSCLDVLRRRKRIRWLPWDTDKHENLLQPHALDNPELCVVSSEVRQDVQAILDQMTPRNKLALLLREFEGLSTEEIGEVMGLSRSAVKSVLFRARDEFRKLYIASNGEAG